MNRPAAFRQVIRVSALCAIAAACAGQPGDAGKTAPPIDDRSMAERKNPAPAATNAPPAPVQRAAIDPASLVGMTGTRISSIFGDPVFVRRDPPGEFWRYRGKSCVLELFFYRRGGAQRVDHIETRANGGKKLKPADCVATLRKSAPKT